MNKRNRMKKTPPAEKGVLGSGGLTTATKMLIVFGVVFALCVVIPLAVGVPDGKGPVTPIEPRLPTLNPVVMGEIPSATLAPMHLHAPKVRMEKGHTGYAYAEMRNNKPTLRLLDPDGHEGRWCSVDNRWLLNTYDTELMRPLVDGQPTDYRRAASELYFYVDHFSSRNITFTYGTGWLETYTVFNETEGNVTYGEYDTTNLVLDLNFSAIWLNGSSYEIPDRSSYSNNGTLHGLTGNTLSNSTVITVNTENDHLITIPYYNNITQANLSISYNNTGGTDVLVNISIGASYIANFTATASHGDTVGVVNIHSYLTPNTSNRFHYESNGSVFINKTQLDYTHDLTTITMGGVMGYAFDGVNDYISGTIPQDMTNGTVEMWVIGEGDVCLFQNYGRPSIHINHEKEAWFTSALGVYVLWNGATGMAHGGTYSNKHYVSEYAPNHITFTWTPTNYKIYVDGTQTEDRNFTASAKVNNDFNINRLLVGSNYRKGIENTIISYSSTL